MHERQRTRKHLFAVLFWLGVVGLVLASLIPDVSLPVKTIEAGGFRIRISREVLAHMLGCGLLAWLYVKAYGFSIRGVGFMLVLAFASEVIQYLFTAGRNIEGSDLTSNTMGVGFGMLLERLEAWCSGSRGGGKGDNDNTIQ